MIYEFCIIAFAVTWADERPYEWLDVNVKTAVCLDNLQKLTMQQLRWWWIMFAGDKTDDRI